MENWEYLTEYQILKQLPTDTWLDFIVLKYDEPPPPPHEMFEDCRKWVGKIARTVRIEKEGKLVWFARVEDKDDGENFMPRHLHVLLGRHCITDRTMHGSNLKLWAYPRLRQMWFSKQWEHGHAYIQPFDTKPGDGVGYVCKLDRRSDHEETYFSTGLKKLVKEANSHAQ